MIKIEKVLNNNVIVYVNEEGKEVIAIGRGIAFKKKAGEVINKDQIQKVFLSPDDNGSMQLQQLISKIPLDYIDISSEIISLAQTKYNKKLNSSIYLSLTDHIYSSIERHKQGLQLSNGILWEIKRLYKEEFEIGKEALKIIERVIDVKLPEDEAGFIAMHFVNAQLNEDMPAVMNMTKMMNDILNIVKYHFQLEFNEDSISYSRFITHLKFFTQRVINKSYYEDSNDELFEIVKRKYKKELECIEKINLYMQEKFNYSLTNEEIIYLAIHISRIVS